MLLSGVGTNAIGYDLSPGVSLLLSLSIFFFLNELFWNYETKLALSTLSIFFFPAHQ